MNKDQLNNVLHKFTRVFSNIHWNGLRALFNGGVYYSLKEEDLDTIRTIIAHSNYIILTYRKSHLTTWLIGALSFIKNHKWPDYVHALMNVDNETNKDNWTAFKLMEATNAGVHYSTFMQVFDCDHVCILKPVGFTDKEWTDVMEKLLHQEGKPYDDLFDLATDQRVSCVELVRVALQGDRDYEHEFTEFENMIKKTGNLTPQMFRDCPDFEVVLEIKR